MATETGTATKECPYCSEQISINAKKCKHCGEFIDVALRAAEESKKLSSNPTVFMNAGGGGGGAVADSGKKSFPHLLHFIKSFVTAGLWIFVWIPMYLFRNNRTYY